MRRRLSPTPYEWAMLALLLTVLAALMFYVSEIADLRCRIARMETLAISADPLPDCDDVPARTPRRKKGSEG